MIEMDEVMKLSCADRNGRIGRNKMTEVNERAKITNLRKLTEVEEIIQKL